MDSDITPKPDVLQRIKDLETELGLAQYEITGLKHKLAHATAAHSAQSRKIENLRRDWPEIHRRYFTNAGTADISKPVSTLSKKPKNRKPAKC
ncbi:hypothetical protein D9M70_401550 [compost metagenome]